MSDDIQKKNRWQDQAVRRVAPKTFEEPTDRPFASLESMTAEEMELAIAEERKGNKA